MMDFLHLSQFLKKAIYTRMGRRLKKPEITAIKWTAKRLSGNFSPAENRAYEEWLSQDLENCWQMALIEHLVEETRRLHPSSFKQDG